MNINKNESTKNKQKKEIKKEILKKLPYIQKITPVRTLFERSSKSYSSLLPRKNNQIPNSSKPQIIQRDEVNTKLYKVNDYLSMTNKEYNIFSNTNYLNKTRNKKQILNPKNNTSYIKGDTGKTLFHFNRNNSTNDFNINPQKNQKNNILKLNLYNNHQKKSNFNKTNNSINNDSTNNNNTINYFNNNNNDYYIKKIKNYNLNLIKKSRYFSKTKYINGIKNKIKDNPKHVNKSLSTKNISLENTRSTSIHKTINDIRVEKLLNKCKNIDEYNKKNINKENKKTQDVGVGTDSVRVNNAIFYDFIPIILQHMKQKETLDENNKDHENSWLYNKINNIYNDNSSEITKGSIKFKNNLLENPIIKYLFLERTLYNLRHIVQFVDIQNRESFEEKVLKVMGEEYAKIKEKQSIYNKINDFSTFGYEFDPRLFIKFKQHQREEEEKILFNYNKINKNVENKNQDKLSNKNKKEFFTTNKSDFKNDDEYKNNDNESNNKSSSDGGGILGKVMLAGFGISNKVRHFEGLKNKDIENKRSIFNFSNNDNFFNRNDIIISKDKKENDEKKDDLNPLFENEQLRLTQQIQNDEIKRLDLQFLENDDNINLNINLNITDKNNNISKDNDNFNPNRNNLDLGGVKHLINDIQTKDKIKKRKGYRHFKIYSIKKKKKKKKKVNKTKSSEKGSKEESNPPPPSDFDLINSGVTIPQPEIKEEPKKKAIIRSKFDYERYKEEKIKQIELNRKSTSIIFDALKKQDIKKPIIKKNSLLNELYYSSNSKNDNEEENDERKKFDKIKKIEEKENNEESELDEEEINQMKKGEEEEEEEKEEKESNYSSVDVEGLEELDISKDMENKGVIKKNWMENSPKFKNKIIDFSNKRRFAITNDSHEMFDALIRNERIKNLNEKMQKVYDKIERKRKEFEYKKKKKKKKRPFSFEGVDLTSVAEIEKKKKIFLNRIKEDIKYKINEGKYHLIEMENFKTFDEAMDKFKLKAASDIKKVRLYVNLVEKYLHFYQVELDNREKEKMDEDRINKFLRNLNREIYVTLPYVKDIKGRHCHSVDYFKELQELSMLHDF